MYSPRKTYYLVLHVQPVPGVQVDEMLASLSLPLAIVEDSLSRGSTLICRVSFLMSRLRVEGVTG